MLPNHAIENQDSMQPPSRLIPANPRMKAGMPAAMFAASIRGGLRRRRLSNRLPPASRDGAGIAPMRWMKKVHFFRRLPRVTNDAPRTMPMPTTKGFEKANHVG